MTKKTIKKSEPNGNVFKTVVRGVVREELHVVREEIQEVREELRETEKRLENKLDEKLDATFRKYRDETLIKMDEVIGELKTIREEQTAHFGLHDDLTERVENLEVIHPQGTHAK